MEVNILLAYQKKKIYIYINIVWTLLKNMEINIIYFLQIEQANERKRVQIECAVWHLDVGLAHPHERRNHEGFDCSSIKELHELGLRTKPINIYKY